MLKVYIRQPPQTETYVAAAALLILFLRELSSGARLVKR